VCDLLEVEQNLQKLDIKDQPSNRIFLFFISFKVFHFSEYLILTLCVCFVFIVLQGKYEYVLEKGKKKLLGRGACGQVYLMRDVHTKQLVAMKFIPFQKLSEANVALKEGILGLTLKHKNILTYSDVFLEENPDVANEYFVCIATEYCEQGDLRKAIDFAQVSRSVCLYSQ
jgi:hypothetical protein